MTRRCVRHLVLAVLVVLPARSAIAQTGRFDLEKTKTVLSGVIQKTLAEMHTPRFAGDYGFGFSMVHDSATGHTLIHRFTM